MIKTFETMNGIEQMSKKPFFTVSHSTESRDSKRDYNWFKTNQGNQIFTEYIIKFWHSLLQDILDVKSTNGIKSRLDKSIREISKKVY